MRITFIAAPEYSGRQHHFNREYFASLFSYELPDGLGPMLTNAYRARMAEGIDSARRALSGLVSNALAAYERPTETSYSWGWGITQRVSHHLLGAGAQPDDVEYLGRYFGLVLTRTTVRRFRLSVRGVASSADADRWAAAVAGAMATTRLACVGP